MVMKPRITDPTKPAPNTVESTSAPKARNSEATESTTSQKIPIRMIVAKLISFVFPRNFLIFPHPREEIISLLNSMSYQVSFDRYSILWCQ